MGGRSSEMLESVCSTTLNCKSSLFIYLFINSMPFRHKDLYQLTRMLDRVETAAHEAAIDVIRGNKHKFWLQLTL